MHRSELGEADSRLEGEAGSQDAGGGVGVGLQRVGGGGLQGMGGGGHAAPLLCWFPPPRPLFCSLSRLRWRGHQDSPDCFLSCRCLFSTANVR